MSFQPYTGCCPRLGDGRGGKKRKEGLQDERQDGQVTFGQAVSPAPKFNVFVGLLFPKMIMTRKTGDSQGGSWSGLSNAESLFLRETESRGRLVHTSLC